MIKYVSIMRPIAHVRDLYGFEEIGDDLMIEWAMDALDAIGAPIKNDVGVYIGEVKNSSLAPPFDVRNIKYIVRYFGPTTDKCNKNNNVEEDCWFDMAKGHICKDKCSGCKEKKGPDFMILYGLQNPWFNSYHIPFKGPDIMKPLRLETKEHMRYWNNADEDAVYITSDNTIHFGFDSGKVMIYFSILPTDENNLPMIPDNYWFIGAIEKYIGMKGCEKMMFAGSDRHGKILQKMELDWDRFRMAARSDIAIPKTIMELQELSDSNVHMLLPNHFDSMML